jgi:hypothetical protein
MRCEQKRQLSVSLANLPIARQARVLRMIDARYDDGEGDEVEIDLDVMDNTTLWRLFDYEFPKSQQLAMGVNFDAPPAAAPPPPAPKPAAGSSSSSGALIGCGQ